MFFFWMITITRKHARCNKFTVLCGDDLVTVGEDHHNHVSWRNHERKAVGSVFAWAVGGKNILLREYPCHLHWWTSV